MLASDPPCWFGGWCSVALHPQPPKLGSRPPTPCQLVMSSSIGQQFNPLQGFSPPAGDSPSSILKRQCIPALWPGGAAESTGSVRPSCCRHKERKRSKNRIGFTLSNWFSRFIFTPLVGTDQIKLAGVLDLNCMYSILYYNIESIYNTYRF